MAASPDEQSAEFKHYLQCANIRDAKQVYSKLKKLKYILGCVRLPFENFMPCIDIWNESFNCIVEFVKNKTGFDFFDDSDLKDGIECLKKLGENLRKLCACGFDIDSDGTWMLCMVNLDKTKIDENRKK